LPLSIVLIKYYTDLGVEFHHYSGEIMWIGVSTQKNGLALRCAFAIFYLLWIRIRRWQKLDTPVTWYQGYIELFILMLAIYLFMGPQHTLTTSATSLATLVIGLAALFGLMWLKRHNIILGSNSLSVVIALIIVYGTIIPFIGGLGVFDVSALLGRGSHLTGRAEVWAQLIPAAKQKLLLGHGFGGFWATKWVEVVRVNEAHNGYLDLILNTGTIGLILSSIFLIISCRKAQQEMTQGSDWGFFGFCIILMTVLHNLTESSLYALTGLMPMIIFLDVLMSKDLQMIVIVRDG
jgi:exopolysaccharide production protein ExoQ